MIIVRIYENRTCASVGSESRKLRENQCISQFIRFIVLALNVNGSSYGYLFLSHSPRLSLPLSVFWLRPSPPLASHCSTFTMHTK